MDEDDKKQLGRIALRQRVVKQAPQDFGLEAELKKLSDRFGVPAVDLRQVCIRLDDLDLLPREVARRHVILPLLVKEDRLFVAMANPTDKKVVDELEFVTDKRVYPYVTSADSLSSAIEEVYKAKASGEAFYIGTDCPPDVVETAMSQRYSTSPPQSLPGQTEPRDSLPPGAAGVFLDDATDRVRSEDIVDDAFGDTSADLSVVTDVPEPSSMDPAAKTVLIVDDANDIRTMLHRLFKSKGYNALEATDGKMALRVVKERSPDVIILDAMLPEVHGFEIARRIKASKRYAHIPIVMVSAVYRGWRFAEDLRETCGVEHYLEKPFKIAEVLAAVESALADREPSSSRDRAMSAEAERELEAGVAAYQAGNMDDAVVHLKHGIHIDPLAYRLHFHLGLLYGKKGMVYDAIAEIERAVEINGRHFPALKNLAILYQKAGFRNKAAEAWHRALNAAPDETTRESIKQHLVSLL
jgi:DNA-binding response OmpR family regulator